MASNSSTLTRNLSAARDTAPGAESQPLHQSTDYRFVNCWHRNELGEHWQIRTPAGDRRFAHVIVVETPDVIRRVSTQIADLQHPNLVDYTVETISANQLLLATSWPNQTLWDYFHHCRAYGWSGIPRDELLDHWHVIAETLDALAKTHQYFHLWLHPCLLFVDERRIKIAGFALPDFFLRSIRKPLKNLAPRYAAPEVAKCRPLSRCDQFSLAVMFVELASGVYPFRSQRHYSDPKPDLDLLSSSERDVIERALCIDPRSRYPTCLDFVRALRSAQQADDVMGHDFFRPAMMISGPSATGDATIQPDVLMEYFVSELALLAAGLGTSKGVNQIRYTMHDDRLEHQCVARIFPGVQSLKLDGFRQQWQAQSVVEELNRTVYRMNLATPLWKQLLGRRARLEIDIQIDSDFRRPTQSEVIIILRPIGCSPNEAGHALRHFGPLVLDNIRMYLQAGPEQRAQDRTSIMHPLRVSPVFSGGPLKEPIHCITKDISPSGIGFYLPRSVDTSQVYVNLPAVEQISDIAGLAHIVRKSPCHDGWLEIGATFESSR